MKVLFLHMYNQKGCLIGYWLSDNMNLWAVLKLQKIAIDAGDSLVTCTSVF